MPIEVGIWKLGEKLHKVAFSTMASESKLEDCFCEDLSILAPGLLLIKRQVVTDYGKQIDLLAIDSDGDLTVVELKRDKTPREVVAQTLDYASWVQDLSYEDVKEIYEEGHGGSAFEEGFADAFGSNPPEKINQNHKLVVVASELDSATERIINYLADNYGVPINAVFFRYFKDGEDEYLTRTWLIDPQEAEAKTSHIKKKEQESWNGRDFYVNCGDGSENGEGVYRSWDDARKYGYVSAGGGTFYSKSLGQLFPGARVFVYIPKNGYVAVGIVEGEKTPVTEFNVSIDGDQVPIAEVPLACSACIEERHDADLIEYFVPVKWIKAVPKDQAYHEKGFFANTNTVCKLRNKFTLEHLTSHFGLNE